MHLHAAAEDVDRVEIVALQGRFGRAGVFAKAELTARGCGARAVQINHMAQGDASLVAQARKRGQVQGSRCGTGTDDQHAPRRVDCYHDLK